MVAFTQTSKEENKIQIPYFEDARSNTAPYYSTQRNIKDVQKEISAIIDELGGERIRFVEGYFGDKPKRYGYVVNFIYADNPAQIVSAGLPMKSETPNKKQTVMTQAMLIVRDQLKAALTAQVFSPGSYPLMQYVLGDGGKNLGEIFSEHRDMLLKNSLPEKITVEKESL